MVLRCTAKLLKLLGVKPSALEDPSNEAPWMEWYGNLLWIDGRKWLLFTHGESLFSFVVPNVLKRRLLPLETFISQQLRSQLADEGLPSVTFGDLGSLEISLAKTASRRVLGCMIDLANYSRYINRASGRSDELAIQELNHRLRRTIHSTTEYEYPIEIVRARGS